jgi:sugar phosphate isomerase/epimerase
VVGVTDMRDCFGSITSEAIVARLLRIGAPPAAAVELGAVLRGFAEVGVRGLPVGPAPSAILANAVLAALDEVLRARGLPHVRWVDDVVFAAPDARTARAAIGALRRVAGDLGLTLHDGKTVVLDDPDERRAFVGAGIRRPSRATGPRMA